ncbi:MAG: acetylornithine deacetylase [Sedimenticolaceae bacterium]|nr:acetylornithine deacetylase [Sedimenticolaceae bacterium]
MRTPTIRQSLESLIASPSVSSVNAQWDQGNRGVIELLDQWFTDLGFRSEILPIDGYPGKYNLVASAGSGPEGLVLSGHTDTVPFDESNWHQSPFRLTERDNRLYGLGTCDMKGFFALVLEAVRDLDLTQLRQPLTIIATADEESTMCGALAIRDLSRHLGRHVVIGEPTNLRPIRMHKGMYSQRLRIIGHSGHSSNPALGNNAMEGMHKAMSELLAWRAELQQRYRNPLFEVDVPTINLGHIHGGDNPNRICGSCELQFDFRPLPGMDYDDLYSEIEQRIVEKLKDSVLDVRLERLFDGIPPMETPATAAIVRATEELTGHAPECVAFGTEGPYFNAMGMETVILGPGDIAQAHQPDEYVALERLQPMVTILKKLIQRFCLEERNP